MLTRMACENCGTVSRGRAEIDGNRFCLCLACGGIDPRRVPLLSVTEEKRKVWRLVNEMEYRAKPPVRWQWDKRHPRTSVRDDATALVESTKETP